MWRNRAGGKIESGKQGGGEGESEEQSESGGESEKNRAGVEAKLRAGNREGAEQEGVWVWDKEPTNIKLSKKCSKF